eukprot:scaffold2094_cov239-Pinguiococcus_pyrenoidosus.AAC.14
MQGSSRPDAFGIGDGSSFPSCTPGQDSTALSLFTKSPGQGGDELHDAYFSDPFYCNYDVWGVWGFTIPGDPMHSFWRML